MHAVLLGMFAQLCILIFCLKRVAHLRFKERGFSNTTPGNAENEDAFGEKMEQLKLRLVSTHGGFRTWQYYALLQSILHPLTYG